MMRLWGSIPVFGRIALYLTAPAVILTLIYFGGGTPGDWRALIGNVAASLLGSLFTVFFVDRLLQQADEQRRLPGLVAGLRACIRVITRFVLLLGQMRKAAIDPSERFPSRVDELLSTETFRILLNHLDLNANGPVHPPMSWHRYIPVATADLSEQIREILQSFGSLLPVDLIADLSDLKNSTFFQIARMLPSVYEDIGRDFGPNQGRLG